MEPSVRSPTGRLASGSAQAHRLASGDPRNTEESALKREHGLGNSRATYAAYAARLLVSAWSLTMLAAPALANPPAPDTVVPPKGLCGLLGGATLSLMLVAFGAWAVRSQWRSRY